MAAVHDQVDMVHMTCRSWWYRSAWMVRMLRWLLGEGKHSWQHSRRSLMLSKTRCTHCVCQTNLLCAIVKWMAPLFQFHGLTVDCIDKHEPNLSPAEMRTRQMVVYGTNNEFRALITCVITWRAIRKNYYKGSSCAMVDEVDSVLIARRVPIDYFGPVPRAISMSLWFETANQ